MNGTLPKIPIKQERLHFLQSKLQIHSEKRRGKEKAWLWLPRRYQISPNYGLPKNKPMPGDHLDNIATKSANSYYFFILLELEELKKPSGNKLEPIKVFRQNFQLPRYLTLPITFCMTVIIMVRVICLPWEQAEQLTFCTTCSGIVRAPLGSCSCRLVMQEKNRGYWKLLISVNVRKMSRVLQTSMP